VNVSHALIRKAAISVVLLLVFIALDITLGRRLPTSFLPERTTATSAERGPVSRVTERTDIDAEN
jgi:hypothetical protein